MKLPAPAPLSDDEIERLDDALASLSAESMTIETLDGFFTALLCGPELVKPSVWLPAVLGGERDLGSDAEATDMLELLFRHWNTVVAELALTEDDPDARMLLVAEDDEGIAHGNDWAHGFLQGASLYPDDWAPLLDNDEAQAWLAPILALHHEDDPDPKVRTPALTDEERDGVITLMSLGVAEIYRFFAPMRLARANPDANTPVRRQTPKVGRNDPCPCGSGQKYKQCCGADA